MPEPTPPPTPPPAPAPITSEAINSLQGDAFRGIFPEDIRGKGYMKDVNTFGDLVKKFDGAQSLLGQRNVPEENAAPEQWETYFKHHGRPEKAEDYKIGEIEGVPKEYIAKAVEVGVLRKFMHSAGMNPKQAQIFARDFLKFSYDSDQAETKASNKAFDDLMVKTFGPNHQEIRNGGKAALAAHVPDEVKPFVNELDDKSLGIVLALADNIVKKFGAEDTFRKGGGAPPAGGLNTVEAIRAEMTKIMAQPEYKDSFKNPSKNAELNTQMNSLREKLKNITGQK